MGCPEGLFFLYKSFILYKYTVFLLNDKFFTFTLFLTLIVWSPKGFLEEK